jgi:hypothetical protein
MSATASPNTHRKAVTETRDVGVSFVPKLATGALLTGTPTVTQLGANTDLTIGSVQRNGSTLSINGKECIADQAVLFRASGGTAALTYTLRVHCSTVAGEVLEVDCTLGVDA